MQKWLDNNGILIYSIHNEGKSIVAERFIRTLSFFYLYLYLNKAVDQCNNTYHRSIGKKLIWC